MTAERRTPWSPPLRNLQSNTGTPISEDYHVPFKFTGKHEKVTIQTADFKLTEEQLQHYREGRVKAALAQ